MARMADSHIEELLSKYSATLLESVSTLECKGIFRMFFPNFFTFIFQKLCKPDGPLSYFHDSSQTHCKLCYCDEHLTDFESNQDFIEDAEDEANIDKPCEYLLQF